MLVNDTGLTAHEWNGLPALVAWCLGTGLFALILARTALDQVARWTCRE